MNIEKIKQFKRLIVIGQTQNRINVNTIFKIFETRLYTLLMLDSNPFIIDNYCNCKQKRQRNRRKK